MIRSDDRRAQAAQPAWAVMLAILVCAALVLALCLAILLPVKRLLGTRSRYLTGY